MKLSKRGLKSVGWLFLVLIGMAALLAGFWFLDETFGGQNAILIWIGFWIIAGSIILYISEAKKDANL